MALATSPSTHAPTTQRTPEELDLDRLSAFVGKAVGDFGALVNGALVVIGDRLGLYRAMVDGQPVTPVELAQRTGTDVPNVEEWLNAQVGGRIRHPRRRGPYRLPRRTGVALTDETSSAFVDGGFHSGSRRSIAITCRGVPTGSDRWAPRTRPLPRLRATVRALVSGVPRSTRIPALDGVQIGSWPGRGGRHRSAMSRPRSWKAQAYPRSTFTGFDPHPGSVAAARRAGEEAGLGVRVRFEVAAGHEVPGTYDLVTVCDALHDMGDPVGAARHLRSALATDGTLMVVEPLAGDAVDDNLHPVGAAYYAFSTFLCTAGSRSQPVGLALGAQAGERRLREVLTAAGFGHVRRVADSALNMVLEARPDRAA